MGVFYIYIFVFFTDFDIRDESERSEEDQRDIVFLFYLEEKTQSSKHIVR